MPVYTPTIVVLTQYVAALSIGPIYDRTSWDPTVVPPPTGSRTVVAQFIDPFLAYSSIILATSGLVAYWRLGEQSGTSMIDRGGTNTGVYVNSPVLGVSGAIVGDTATEFHAMQTMYAEVPDAAALDVGDTFSIEFWAKRSSTGAGHTVLDKGVGGPYVFFGTTNYLTLTAAGAAIEGIVRSTQAQTDTTAFHHYVITKAGATSKVYVDGSPDYVSLTNVAVVSTANVLRVATRRDATLSFDGVLDELSIYNIELSAAQVLSRLNAGRSAGGPRSPTVFLDSPVFAPTVVQS